MIILEHHIDPSQNVAYHHNEKVDVVVGATIHQVLDLAKRFPEEWIGWKDSARLSFELSEFTEKATINCTAVSKGFAPSFIVGAIDYVEDSPFVNFKPQQWYPTWIMSADQGMIHASVLQTEFPQIKSVNWEYDLNVLTRTLQPKGLLCYSCLTIPQNDAHENQIYSFVKRTSKKRWLLFLLCCHWLYENRFPFISFLTSLLERPFDYDPVLLQIQKSSNELSVHKDYDVIIPTMGRPAYLKDVLLDLSKQTVIPQQVVIIEQDEDVNSNSQLDYLTEKEWPFKIEHQFIHQSGACNARNLALAKTKAPWVLLFDDDARFDKFTLEKMLYATSYLNVKCINVAYIQKEETESQKTYKQWPYFGSGCSIVHRDIVEQCSFDMALEHGYGEDVDYGMQIRNAGYDVVYAPQIQILHLKAPIGGFRKPHVFPWKTDSIQPKPSPHIMYYRKKNYSVNQLLGYKLVQLFKTYGSFGTKLPWLHYQRYEKAWNQSQKWAAQL